ncbi:c-type cytochrome [Devosia sediminis]|uniref:C-type cytochrome n=1 Tax=Devosia sediminis TaxID=2798801 RepID=A0A934ITT0_9HYPH|nr:c-type cytochrome [Devosia sediminis]MBJ3785016.1 c-type cytochrome [Devosia sediminis]
MKRIPLVLASAAAGAFFILALPLSGLIDHSARPGSNAIVDWYSQTAARQSIALRSAMTGVPDLDDPASIRRGAGHFQLVCAACHGSPEAPAARFAEDMSPRPPALTAWRPEARLFQTIKYGIRHSAMPAWPSLMRDDEVWDMVAFVRRLPTMNAIEYAALAHGDADPGTCASCHGETGEGRDNAFPRLDIQSPQYLADALAAFRDGSRQSGTMMAAARQLTDAQIAELSQTFGQRLPVGPAADNELGARIAREGIVSRDVPACDTCHGPTGRVDFPRLAGQPVDYLRLQLELFQKHGAERGGRHAEVMAKVVEDALEEGPHRLEPEEIEAVAEHYGQ